MTHRAIVALVGPDSDGMRLDAFLAAQDGAPSRSACAKLIEGGAVSINGTPGSSKAERVVLGDRIQALLPVEEEPGPLSPNFSIPLDVRLEDEWLIVLSKQAGLVCHPSPGHTHDTLANALVAHCGYGHLGHLQGDDRPGIVHRLDMDTSGLMVTAKDDETQRALHDLDPRALGPFFDYYLTFAISAEVGVLIRWLVGGMRESDEQMAGLMTGLMFVAPGDLYGKPIKLDVPRFALATLVLGEDNND